MACNKKKKKKKEKKKILIPEILRVIKSSLGILGIVLANSVLFGHKK